ncbi:hypothetical protein HPP92_024928 [Vanilla planifolia]|uniref:Uncharacterized protein n=1 Tax=Vanilla planifolia TaxID=51239 RepID=A0A835U8J1_VANPL|nr:hypothetical protein HPP92_024928 [Vanilla planifolia]
MSGVWRFKNGVVRLVENPASEQSSTIKRKALLYVPTNEVINSYASLECILLALGWERYHEDPELLQFHKRSCIDLISLPVSLAAGQCTCTTSSSRIVTIFG